MTSLLERDDRNPKIVSVPPPEAKRSRDWPCRTLEVEARIYTMGYGP